MDPVEHPASYPGWWLAYLQCFGKPRDAEDAFAWLMGGGTKVRLATSSNQRFLNPGCPGTESPYINMNKQNGGHCKRWSFHRRREFWDLNCHGLRSKPFRWRSLASNGGSFWGWDKTTGLFRVEAASVRGTVGNVSCPTDRLKIIGVLFGENRWPW